MCQVNSKRSAVDQLPFLLSLASPSLHCMRQNTQPDVCPLFDLIAVGIIFIEGPPPALHLVCVTSALSKSLPCTRYVSTRYKPNFCAVMYSWQLDVPMRHCPFLNSCLPFPAPIYASTAASYNLRHNLPATAQLHTARVKSPLLKTSLQVICHCWLAPSTGPTHLVPPLPTPPPHLIPLPSRALPPAVLPSSGWWWAVIEHAPGGSRRQTARQPHIHCFFNQQVHSLAQASGTGHWSRITAGNSLCKANELNEANSLYPYMDRLPYNWNPMNWSMHMCF